MELHVLMFSMYMRTWTGLNHELRIHKSAKNQIYGLGFSFWAFLSYFLKIYFKFKITSLMVLTNRQIERFGLQIWGKKIEKNKSD